MFEHEIEIAQAAAAYCYSAWHSMRRGIIPSDGHLCVIVDNRFADDSDLRR
jgi:hypothetical protein